MNIKKFYLRSKLESLYEDKKDSEEFMFQQIDEYLDEIAEIDNKIKVLKEQLEKVD